MVVCEQSWLAFMQSSQSCWHLWQSAAATVAVSLVTSIPSSGMETRETSGHMYSPLTGSNLQMGGLLVGWTVAVTALSLVVVIMSAEVMPMLVRKAVIATETFIV